MSQAFCSICHNYAHKPVLSFKCDEAGAINDMCTDVKNKPLVICESCYELLITPIKYQNRLMKVGEDFYWTLGFPGVNSVSVKFTDLPKDQQKFLFSLIIEPPTELVEYINNLDSKTDNNTLEQ